MKKILFLILFIMNTLVQAESLKPFELPVHDQQRIFKSKDYQGKTLVLNFWASWCIACIQEMPELNSLMEKNKRDDIIFIGINAGDTTVQIKKSLRKHKFNFLILEDSTKEISKKLGVSELPRTLVISPNGEVVYSHSKPPKSIYFLLLIR